MRGLLCLLVAGSMWVCVFVDRAQACGGTFCDRTPVGLPPMVVDQSGENVVFVTFDGYVEAHVQVTYTGDPERFAWVVPMPRAPEVEIGSQLLFDALLAATNPVFGVRTMIMNCEGDTSTSESTGCGSNDTASGTSGGVSMGGSDSGMDEDPIGQTVGSYDVTILQPNDTDEILDWLDTNDFELPDRARELLGPYVDQGMAFVALRLTPGRDVQDIHPIVFRYEGTRPGIPIRLTAVAATDDMRVRTLFLGDGRYVPTNYRHVQVNPVSISWPTFGLNYRDVVRRAVDATGDGLGFVTEYAGSSDVVDASRVFDERWDADVFEGLDPVRAMAALTDRGLVECSNGRCVFQHPLLLPLLRQYLPAPSGADENAFYGCLTCQDELDITSWDGAAFAADMRERIIEPARHAADILATRPYLTRMLTRISPEEMTADPAFHLRTDLEDVPRERWVERQLRCGKPPRYVMEDGRKVVDNASFGWTGSLGDMPAASSIEMVGESGAPLLVASFDAEIDATLETANEQRSEGFDDYDPATDVSAGCSVHPGIAQHALPFTAVVFLWLRRRRLAHARRH